MLSRYSIRQVACGYGHSLAVSHAGDLFSWGANEYGQLGLGVYHKIRYAPALVQRLPDDWEEQREELKALADANAASIGEPLLLSAVVRLTARVCVCVGLLVCVYILGFMACASLLVYTCVHASLVVVPMRPCCRVLVQWRRRWTACP